MTTQMACPVCQATPVNVVKVRKKAHNELGRVRECPEGHRFTTFESIDRILNGN